MTLPVSTAPEWMNTPSPVPYPAAVETMRERVTAIRAGAAGEQIWLLEHPPLYTHGTSAKPADLVDANRFETFAAGRGGQWTYHGPGQLVAYIMLDLLKGHGAVPPRDTHAYVSALEAVLIDTISAFGVRGGVRAGRVGVWVEDAQTGKDNKIAAIGVRITRWVSWHGISLNVHPNLEHFSGIVPCGISEHGVTSLQALGHTTTMQDANTALRRAFSKVFGPVSSGAASAAALPATAP